MENPPPEQVPEPLTIEAVLADRPPGQAHDLELPLPVSRSGIRQFYESTFRQPALQLWCDNEPCEALMWFDPDGEEDGPKISARQGLNDQVLRYRCRHCKERIKYLSILIDRFRYDSPRARVIKFGEFPAFGMPLPTRLITLAGRHQELLFKGRRCENQGLGIAAFAYYRRIVEETKNDILNELIKAANVIGADAQLIANLEKAKTETQFVRAIEIIKPGVPESLMIHGQNPLQLLHGALSEGLHSLSDERCLELATAVRLVLSEMSERLAIVMKQSSELNKAIQVLSKSKK